MKWLEVDAMLLTRTPEVAKSVFAGEAVSVVAVDRPQEISAEVDGRAASARVVVFDPPIVTDDLAASSGPAWQDAIDTVRAGGRQVVRFTDELAPTSHSCDLLVNDHPLAESYSGTYPRVGRPGPVLAGPRYFLIDPDHDTEPRQHDGVLVSFGGGDQSGLLKRMRTGLQQLSEEIPVHVVAGPNIAVDLEVSERLAVHRHLAPREFAKLLTGARLALTASGNTLFERAYHNVSGVSIAQFPHQDTIGREFDRFGITRHLGLGTEISPAVLIRHVLDLAEDKRARESQVDASRRLDVRGGCAAIVQGVRSLY